MSAPELAEPELRRWMREYSGHLLAVVSSYASDAVAAEDSAIVTAYRKAGLVLFAKSNTPEFGLATVTEPVANGRTLNPWNLDHTSGGSSGGAASAVASGIVPAAHGSVRFAKSARPCSK